MRVKNKRDDPRMMNDLFRKETEGEVLNIRVMRELEGIISIF